MATHETELEKSFNRIAKEHGWLPFKFVSPGNRAVPDRLYFRAGVTVLLEWKLPGKTPTAHQWHWLDQFRRQGFQAEYVDSHDIASDIIQGRVVPAGPKDRSHPSSRLNAV